MGNEMLSILISEIHLDSEFNCRGHLAPIDVMDIAKDMDKRGQIQPVILMEYPGAKAIETGFKYLLTVGYRRTTAAKINKWTHIDAIIRSGMSEAEARCLNLRENVQRKDLNIMQEALAIAKLKDLGMLCDACAAHLGMSRGWVQIRYSLLDLPVEVQAEAAAGLINQTQIREIYTIKNKQGIEACFDAVKKIKKAKLKGLKGISVNPNLKDPERKVIRKRPEIFDKMEHLEVNLGNGLATRCMAWCSGEITTRELNTTIKEQCEARGITYTEASD